MKGRRKQNKRWMIGFLIVQWLVFSVESPGYSAEANGPPESPLGSDQGLESWEFKMFEKVYLKEDLSERFPVYRMTDSADVEK